MPPRKSNTLTEAELRLMKLLWARGESAVSDLVAAIPEGEALAYTSVLTTVRILEQKGYVRHRQEGREFIYRPMQPRGQAGRSALARVLDVFFGGSLESAVAAHLSDPRQRRKPDANELRRLAELIEEAKKRGA